MLLPSFKLTFTTAIPLVLAPAASLSSFITAFRALWIFQELLVNVRSIQSQETFHLTLYIGILVEEVFKLVLGNSLPITVFHYTSSHFRKLLHDEGVLLGNIAIPHHRHLFKGTKHTSKYWKLVNQSFIQIFSKSKQVLFPEWSYLVLSIWVLRCKHIVYGKPYLCLDFGNLVQILSLNNLPSLVLESFCLAFGVQSDPWLDFKKRYKHAR